MISVTEKYLIEVDDLNYTVYVNRPKKETDKKTGKQRDRYPVVGYYGSMADAVSAVRARVIRDGLKNVNGPLSEAIEEVKRISTEFDKTMKEIFE